MVSAQQVAGHRTKTHVNVKSERWRVRVTARATGNTGNSQRCSGPRCTRVGARTDSAPAPTAAEAQHTQQTNPHRAPVPQDQFLKRQ